MKPFIDIAYIFKFVSPAFGCKPHFMWSPPGCMREVWCGLGLAKYHFNHMKTHEFWDTQVEILILDLHIHQFSHLHPLISLQSCYIVYRNVAVIGIYSEGVSLK